MRGPATSPGGGPPPPAAQSGPGGQSQGQAQAQGNPKFQLPPLSFDSSAPSSSSTPRQSTSDDSHSPSSHHSHDDPVGRRGMLTPITERSNSVMTSATRGWARENDKPGSLGGGSLFGGLDGVDGEERDKFYTPLHTPQPSAATKLGETSGKEGGRESPAFSVLSNPYSLPLAPSGGGTFSTMQEEELGTFLYFSFFLDGRLIGFCRSSDGWFASSSTSTTAWFTEIISRIAQASPSGITSFRIT